MVIARGIDTRMYSPVTMTPTPGTVADWMHESKTSGLKQAEEHGVPRQGCRGEDSDEACALINDTARLRLGRVPFVKNMPV